MLRAADFVIEFVSSLNLSVFRLHESVIYLMPVLKLINHSPISCYASNKQRQLASKWAENLMEGRKVSAVREYADII